MFSSEMTSYMSIYVLFRLICRSFLQLPQPVWLLTVFSGTNYNNSKHVNLSDLRKASFSPHYL